MATILTETSYQRGEDSALTYSSRNTPFNGYTQSLTLSKSKSNESLENCDERETIQPTRSGTPKTAEKKSKLKVSSPHFVTLEIYNSQNSHTSEQSNDKEAANLTFQPTYPLDRELEHPLNNHIATNDVLSYHQEGSLELADDKENDFELKFKTEMCRNFVHNGHCKFGNKVDIPSNFSVVSLMEVTSLETNVT